MKALNLWLIVLNILIFPVATLANPFTSDRPNNLSQLDTKRESIQLASETENTEAEVEEDESDEPQEEEIENIEEEDESDEPQEETEIEEEEDEEAKEPTPEEIARLEKLAQADKLYLAGDKTAAVKLYREAKPVWEIEREVNNQQEKAFSDPEELSPAGRVFWRNYQQGKEQELETKTISSLKLLTTREPQFIAGHVHYAQSLLEYEREAESLEVLNNAVSLHPNEPEILRAKMESDVS